MKSRDLLRFNEFLLRFPNMLQLLRFIFDWAHGQHTLHIYIWDRDEFCKSLWTINGNFWLRDKSADDSNIGFRSRNETTAQINRYFTPAHQHAVMKPIYTAEIMMPEEKYSFKWVKLRSIETNEKWDHPVFQPYDDTVQLDSLRFCLNRIFPNIIVRRASFQFELCKWYTRLINWLKQIEDAQSCNGWKNMKR